VAVRSALVAFDLEGQSPRADDPGRVGDAAAEQAGPKVGQHRVEGPGPASAVHPDVLELSIDRVCLIGAAGGPTRLRHSAPEERTGHGGGLPTDRRAETELTAGDRGAGRQRRVLDDRVPRAG